MIKIIDEDTIALSFKVSFEGAMLYGFYTLGDCFNIGSYSV